jgi:hypothetical protein
MRMSSRKRKGFLMTGRDVSVAHGEMTLKLTSNDLVPSEREQDGVEVQRNLGNATNGTALGLDKDTISCLLESHNEVLPLALAQHCRLLLKTLALVLINAADG